VTGSLFLSTTNLILVVDSGSHARRTIVGGERGKCGMSN